MGVLERSVVRRSMRPGLETEISEDYPLPANLRSLLCTYDRKDYGGWPSRTSMPRDGEVFSFWGRRYMIAPSTISPQAGRGLFVAQDIHVPPHSEVTLMSFCGPMYSWSTWHRLVRYTRSMTTYGLCANVASLTEENRARAFGERMYIDGRPYTQGNIAGLINSSRGRDHYTNCVFVECSNSHIPEHMSQDVQIYILVTAIRSLHVGEEILVNYPWRRQDRAPI